MLRLSTFGTFLKPFILAAILLPRIAFVYCNARSIDRRSVQGMMSFFPFLNTHVADKAIKDTYRDTSVLRNRHKHTARLAINSNVKRAASRALRTCPNGQRFVNSYCQDDINPQAYTMMCRLLIPGPVQFGYNDGTCAPDEFCIEGWKRLDNHLEAFCINKEDIIRWSSDQFDKIGRFRATTADLGLLTLGSLGDILLDLVLQDVDLITRIDAANLQLQAQKFVNVRGQPMYQTLPGGVAQCNNCSSVGLYPIPPGTQSVSVDVTLLDIAKKATLWIGSVELR